MFLTDEDMFEKEIARRCFRLHEALDDWIRALQITIEDKIKDLSVFPQGDLSKNLVVARGEHTQRSRKQTFESRVL